MIDWRDKDAFGRFIKANAVNIDALARDSGVSRSQLHRLAGGQFFASVTTQIQIENAISAKAQGQAA